MKKQTFLVRLRIETEIESGGKPYMTEACVKGQVQKLVRDACLTRGLPCHGSSKIVVSEVIESTK